MIGEQPAEQAPSVHFGRPEVTDGGALWRLARDSGKLDLNSAYTYLLWCRDFAGSSVVARVGEGAGEEVAGFVTGYRRPDAGDTFVVWQVAVDPIHRGKGLGLRMLNHLADRLRPDGANFLEATVTPDNEASDRLFTAFARARNAPLGRSELFPAALFPEAHEPEVLLRIGPLV